VSGPSSEQLQLQAEQVQFYQQGIQQSQTTFAEQQDLLKQMKQVYDPILAKGPNQEGFSDAEKSALTSEAVQGTAGNYSRAARAVNEGIAAEGGGPLPSGQSEELRSEVAQSAAGEQSKEEDQILQADYAQGYSEFEGATSALATASHELNPVAFENAATSAGSSAEKTASDINAEQNSWLAPVMGAIGTLGSAAIGKIP
jgi:hypothetical protein